MDDGFSKGHTDRMEKLRTSHQKKKQRAALLISVDRFLGREVIPENEASVERHCNLRVKDLRGISIKLPAMFYPGIPDRLILLPQGRVVFMELKRPKGGKFEPRQPLWLRKLARLGFNVYVCKTKGEVDAALASHC